MIDVFREVRERVSAEDAARRYGMEFDRRGWCRCPFHRDKRPSMSFREGRFRCWACNVSGDSIDFTGRLLGLEPMAAVERLDADFALGLPLHRKPTQAQTQEARRRMEIKKAHDEFEKWREAFISKLCAACLVAHVALRDMETWDDLTEAQVEAIQWQPAFEYLSEALADGTPEEQMDIFRGKQVIQSRIQKILNSTPMKSGAA